MGEDGEEEGGEGERKEETKVSRPWQGDRGGEGVRGRKSEKRQEHSNLGGLMHIGAPYPKVSTGFFIPPFWNRCVDPLIEEPNRCQPGVKVDDN